MNFGEKEELNEEWDPWNSDWQEARVSTQGSLATKPLPLPDRTSWYKSRGPQGWGSLQPSCPRAGSWASIGGSVSCQQKDTGHISIPEMLWGENHCHRQILGNASALEQCRLQAKDSFLQWELVHMWISVVEKSWVTLNVNWHSAMWQRDKEAHSQLQRTNHIRVGRGDEVSKKEKHCSVSAEESSWLEIEKYILPDFLYRNKVICINKKHL